MEDVEDRLRGDASIMGPSRKSPQQHHRPPRRRAACAAIAAAALSSALACAACCAGPGAGWQWREDPAAPFLGEGPFAEDAWREDGDEIALQLAGASVPGQRIASVEQNGPTLTVKTARDAPGMETMDLQTFGFRLCGGDVESVEKVLVDRPSGVAEARKAP